MTLALIIPLAFVIDMFLGDIRFHPVVLMGKIISFGEKKLRSILPKNKTCEFIGGLILSVFLMIISFLVPFIVLTVLYKLNFIIGFIVEVIFCYQIIAMKCLTDSSMKVYNDLKDKNIDKARESVSMIVGRDKDKLDEKAIIKATIESVSENTSDGVIAPLFFLFIGGAPLGFFYKAVNTLDSMIAHKNDKYIYFGKFAARVDDFCNFIPARLSGLLYVASAFVLEYDYKNAFRIFKRDRKNHSSPNSANIESACAGALNIKLGGETYYEGKIVSKFTVGDDIKEPDIEDIKRANKLALTSSVMALLIFYIIRVAVSILIIKVFI